MPRAFPLARLTALLLWLGVATLFAQAPAPISFAKLPKGDTLVIRYEVIGCFSFYGAEFVYTNQAGGSFSVQKLGLEASAGVWSWSKRQEPLGVVRLERGEAVKLDAFLNSCRNPTRSTEEVILLYGGSSTFHIQHRRGNKVIAEEHLSLPAEIPPQEKVLTFDEMLRTLEAVAAKAKPLAAR
ncbi:MAG: hypothetical protein V4773_16070 [Verrucomicrobiota bacterium]